MNKDKRKLYSSPKVEVIETQVQAVICTSEAGGTLGTMEQENPTNLW